MIKGNKLRNIFFFYIQDSNYKEIITNRIHFKCWEQYFTIFDEMTFIVSFNKNLSKDEQDAIFNDFQMMIIEMFPGKDISFKRELNEPFFRECMTFKKYIVDDMDRLDGLTFFGHNKGLTNILVESNVKESIYKWIVLMYYCNFQFFENDIDELNECECIGYGGPKVVYDDTWFLRPLYSWMFSGTFFWMNYPRLNAIIKCRNIQLPSMRDRWYAEAFIGSIIDNTLCASHNRRYLKLTHEWESYFYYNTEGLANDLLAEDFEDFKITYNNLVTDITNE